TKRCRRRYRELQLRRRAPGRTVDLRRGKAARHDQPARVRRDDVLRSARNRGADRGAVKLRTLTIVALVVVTGAGLAARPAAAVPAALAGPVSVFPEPGTHEASPQTTLSFRGIAPSEIGPIRVVGDETGVHEGSWVAHSDGRG